MAVKFHQVVNGFSCELNLLVNQRNTELDNETSYTYFGARYYDSELSAWLSVDPMSDKYPSLSPYCYTANNPVVLVDPRGMLDDWYRDDETGATFWHEGSENFIEKDGVRYRNIGETHSTYSNGKRIDYKQNNVVNIVDVDPNLNLEGGQYIPQQFTTDDGQKVNVDFSYITKDGNNAYNAISIEAVSQFIMGINEANNTGSDINKIGISATTNGEHSSSSRHYIGKAIDICTINNQQVGESIETCNLQNAMNNINKIRENFGPCIKTKNGKDWYVPGHDNHIHISVN